MSASHFFHKADLVSILNKTVDKTLGEVDTNRVFDKTIANPKITGIAGDVIEQSVLGYPADQDQRPDLDIDGILTELKTTGMRQKNESGRMVYEAKEPASITAVSIPTIAKETFVDSKFWHKAENILFVFYEYESGKAVPAAEYADFHLRGYSFHQFNPDDIEILRRDWQMIHDFIEDIQARYGEEDAKKEYPNLSTLINKKTTYLDTAPKYPHPPRFRLRKRVVTAIIREKFDGEYFEKLPDRYLGQSDVERKCTELLHLYLGRSMTEILRLLGVSVAEGKKADSKQYAEQVIVRMFGGQPKKISKIEMFQKFGYVGKAITVSASGARTEDTKLFSVDFDELTDEWIEDENGEFREKTFEDSELYHYLTDNKLLCAVFRENQPTEDGEIILGENMFVGFKILDLSDDKIVAEAKKTWDETRALIKNKQLRYVMCLDKDGNQRYTPKTGLPMGAPNLPKSKDHLFFFRGTGQDATDKININGIDMYRQDYWIKGTYIANMLKEIPIIGAETLSNSHKSKRDKQ
jgi:hypothetical protein